MPVTPEQREYLRTHPLKVIPPAPHVGMVWHSKKSDQQTESDLITTFAAVPEIETVRQGIESERRRRARRN